MRYFIFVKGIEASGPYWSLDYTKKHALETTHHLETDIEIRDEKGNLVCVSKWHSNWHDPDFDPPAMMDFGEEGWFESWK